jgi:hypothetical protein
MSDIACTAAKVALVFPEQTECYNVKLAEAVTQGQALYQTTSGTFGLADASEEGKQQFKGIALEAGNAGEAISMLKQGVMSGYTLGTYEDPVYLSDTAGALSTTPGTMTVYVGRVTALADPALTEVLYVTADWLRLWS